MFLIYKGLGGWGYMSITKNITKLPILIYSLDNREIEVRVKLHDDTLWLSLNQISDLFGRDKSVISKHLKNIFVEKELDRDSVVANFATTAVDNKIYQVSHYNLDAIISVGYRVNSIQGTKFRQWSNRVLKEHLVKGFSVNRNNIQEEGIRELSQTVELLKDTLKNHKLTNEIGVEVTNIILGYSKTWELLLKFDNHKLDHPKLLHEANTRLDYAKVVPAIESLKLELMNKKEATSLFGQDVQNSLERILNIIDQTFEKKELYRSVEEKAANLLYFVIKDHPFTDGNKRIGSFLFLLFLNMHQVRFDISNSTLVAIALLVAESHPDQKDLMIKLIMNLMTKIF